MTEPWRGSGLSSAAAFADRPGDPAGSAQQRPWLQHAASNRRGHPKGRSEAEQRP